MRLSRTKAIADGVLLPAHQELPESPADRTRVTVTVPASGNPVTVTCSGEDFFAEPRGAQHVICTRALSVLTFEYLAPRHAWYAIGGDLPASSGAVDSRAELESVLEEILYDYQSGTGTFGVGRGSGMKPETLALIITQRIRRKRAEASIQD
jgi:hypothetical protein